jgi:hypothetical protein
MSEAEKKASKWPWILVPVGAVSLFFILRYCQQHLPPPGQAEPVEATPAAPASPRLLNGSAA